MLALTSWYAHGRAVRTRSAVMETPPLSPDEWRAFRAQLVAGEGDSSVAQSPANARRLEQQDAQLYDEYMRGIWCHEVSTPEPGGLLLAMPLQAILVRRLQRGDGETPCGWTARLEERLLAALPAADEGYERDALLERWRSSVPLLYRMATAMANEALGKMRLGVVGAAERELWQMQVAALGVRERVCLVLRSSTDRAAAEAVVISRPLATSVDRALARRLLFGDGGGDDDAEEDAEAAVEQLVAAFGASAAVYNGGPDATDAAALCLHGRADLAGASELAPGTGLYMGGAAAAADAVLAGEAKPLEFRWFVGRHHLLSTARGEWMPVACARPLVLKQCQALPTPLWHEAMRLCGGDAAEVSRLMQREVGRYPETG